MLQEDQSEQVPLDFQQGVGTVIEYIPHHGVAGADEHDDQHDPDGRFADPFGQRVDLAR